MKSSHLSLRPELSYLSRPPSNFRVSDTGSALLETYKFKKVSSFAWLVVENVFLSDDNVIRGSCKSVEVTMLCIRFNLRGLLFPWPLRLIFILSFLGAGKKYNRGIGMFGSLKVEWSNVDLMTFSKAARVSAIIKPSDDFEVPRIFGKGFEKEKKKGCGYGGLRFLLIYVFGSTILDSEVSSEHDEIQSHLAILPCSTSSQLVKLEMNEFGNLHSKSFFVDITRHIHHSVVVLFVDITKHIKMNRFLLILPNEQML
ncbi:hypothetical protein CsSME_00021876 [Camellia sinensis var. sinensis]